MITKMVRFDIFYPARRHFGAPDNMTSIAASRLQLLSYLG